MLGKHLDKIVLAKPRVLTGAQAYLCAVFVFLNLGTIHFQTNASSLVLVAFFS